MGASELLDRLESEAQFFVDAEGHRSKVLLDFETYKALIDALELQEDSAAFDAAMESDAELMDYEEARKLLGLQEE